MVKFDQLWVTVIVALLSAVGCGNGGSSSPEATANDATSRCARYTEAYTQCQRKLEAPATPERIGTTRSSLLLHGAAGKDGVARANTTRQCDEALKQMRAMCP